MKNPESPGNNLFLLGAGFTRAVFPGVPLNADLLQCVAKYNPETLLRTYQIRYHTGDIEILLTRLDSEMVELQSEQLRNDREQINEQIAAYFRQFRFGNHKDELIESEWLESLAKEVFADNDIIINLNYDCLLEGLLDYHEVWSPNKGYIEVHNFFEGDLPGNPKNILIAKIHGSEHFVISSGVPNLNKRDIAYPVNETIYPRSGRNVHSGAGPIRPGPYIIAPSFVKIPHERIERMTIRVLDSAAKAKNLVIIGCSLRPEDSFLWLLLTNFLKQQRDKGKLIIADPCAENLAKKIVDHYFRDIREFVLVKTLPKTLQDATEELISELQNRA